YHNRNFDSRRYGEALLCVELRSEIWVGRGHGCLFATASTIASGRFSPGSPSKRRPLMNSVGVECTPSVAATFTSSCTRARPSPLSRHAENFAASSPASSAYLRKSAAEKFG